MIPTLASSGIVLRPLELSDAPALFIALQDPEVQLYRRDAAHKSEAQTRAYIAESLAKGLAWAITRDGAEALGRLALRVDGESGEFGIVLRRAAQRQGLGLGALQLAELYAFGTLALKQLSAEIDAENLSSLALFERAGFTREKMTRQAGRRGLRDIAILMRRRPDLT